MAVTVFVNGKEVVCKTSTGQGYSVPAFPDVCKTPSPAGPVPVPYPSVASSPNYQVARVKQTSATAVKVAGTPFGVVSNKGMGLATFVPNSARQQQLRARLNAINAQIATLPGSNPNQWHKLVDEYVVVAAELYVELASG